VAVWWLDETVGIIAILLWITLVVGMALWWFTRD
jgi:hypothetical protein